MNLRTEVIEIAEAFMRDPGHTSKPDSVNIERQ